MGHTAAYNAGKITLKQYRKMQGLKLQILLAKTPAKHQRALAKYLKAERKLKI
jgi:hypothetical protein